jgi:hypothetical protein
MKLLTEIVDNIQFLEEGTGPEKKHYFQGPLLQFDVANKNKRLYMSELHDPVVKKYMEEKQVGKEGRAWGELDHPDGPTINLKYASHRFVEMHKEGSNWHGKAIICDTDMGRNAIGLMESGGRLGSSSRGMGSLEQMDEGMMKVLGDYRLVTPGDLVSDPSAHIALVNGIMESVSWFFNEDTGSWMAEQATELKKEIKKLSLAEISEKKALIFERWMKTLAERP